MNKTVVIDIVGLSTSLIGEHTPFLANYTKTRSVQTISPMLPALTTSVQSTFVTGKWPEEHGIVGNGWYDREDCEVKFWKQSAKLVRSEKIWDAAKKQDPSFSSSIMFWWYNMYQSADYTVTPRPNYLADGRKMPDCYSHPSALRDYLQKELGPFPLFKFWGPGANIESSKWIADATILTDIKHDPTLTLVYLPHLDYCLQKYGQDLNKISDDLKQIDKVVEDLIQYYTKKGASIILLSEYGIADVNQPVHINRILRQHNLLNIRVERGLEVLDAGASKAFAVADHQIAHLYINDPSVSGQVRTIVENIPGVELVLNREEQKGYHIGHERAGDLVLMADKNSWFTYYFWMDDLLAPDFARVVDIHKKPGYDPVEMFMSSKGWAAYKLLRKKAGLRYVMDVIPLDANLVKGSHGRIGTNRDLHPILIADKHPVGDLQCTDIYEVIWHQLTAK